TSLLNDDDRLEHTLDSAGIATVYPTSNERELFVNFECNNWSVVCPFASVNFQCGAPSGTPKSPVMRTDGVCQDGYDCIDVAPKATYVRWLKCESGYVTSFTYYNGAQDHTDPAQRSQVEFQMLYDGNSYYKTVVINPPNSTVVQIPAGIYLTSVMVSARCTN